jgi:hypothetical protein
MLKVGGFHSPRNFRIATDDEPRQLQAPPASMHAIVITIEARLSWAVA